MAGTLTISTLSDGTNSTSSTNPIKGSAKAWVNFDGTLSTPITPRASYNVSSVTKVTTGIYTINFTTAFSDTYYAVTGISGYTQGGSSTSQGYISITGNAPLLTTSVSVSTSYANGASLQDNGTVCVAIFR